MPDFDFRAYLEFAEDTWKALGGDPCPFQNVEAAHRSIIGRAYYASVHAVAGKLTARNISFNDRKGEFHGSVVDKSKRLHAALSQRLSKLRQMRERCDYNSSAIIVTEHAGAAIEDAKYIFRVLDTLRP